MASDLPNDLPNGHVEQPPEVRRAVAAIAKTRVTEALFVFVAVIAALGLIGATAWNTYKVRSLTDQNVKAQNFGLLAVDCILDNLADHRWSNQVFHDNLAEFFKAPTTPHVPLPVVPTDAQFAADCAPFNLRTEKREGTGGATVTTMGGSSVTTTSR